MAEHNMTRVQEKPCIICKKLFTPQDRAQKALVCGPACRQIRKLAKNKKAEGSGTGLNPDGSIKSKFLVRGTVSNASGAISGTGSATF